MAASPFPSKITFAARFASIIPILALSQAIVISAPIALEFITIPALPKALPVTTLTFATVALAKANASLLAALAIPFSQSISAS